MIIVQLNGGLGNQLFQYGLGKSMAVRHDCPLLLDVTTLNNSIRSYSLGDFMIDAKIATNKQINAFGYHIRVGRRNFMIKNPFTRKNIFRESGFRFDQEVFNHMADTFFIGYWQSYKYLEEIRAVLGQEIRLRADRRSEDFESVASRIRQQQPAIAMHIRRGDYLGNHASDYHGIMPIQYYAEAIAFMIAQVSDQFTLFVFSDDIEWCRANLGTLYHSIVFVDQGLSQHEDLTLMSLCNHHIIANSTFSWWGAWLSSSPGKIVVRPEQWFKKSDIDTTDMFPPEWVAM